MDDEAAFRRAVIEDPDNDAPRLIFADWLDERDDPYGEFIRVQCELAPLDRGDDRRAPLYTREKRLLADHQRRWVGELRPLLRGWTYRRGFIELAAMGVNQFLDGGRRLFDREPVRSLNLHGGSRRAAELARSPLLARLVELDFSRSAGTLDDDAVIELAASPHLTSLQSLRLLWNQIGDRGAIALARSEHLGGLQSLDLLGNDDITEEGQAALRERFGSRVRY